MRPHSEDQTSLESNAPSLVPVPKATMVKVLSLYTLAAMLLTPALAMTLPGVDTSAINNDMSINANSLDCVPRNPNYWPDPNCKNTQRTC